jgi:hypothetical protein
MSGEAAEEDLRHVGGDGSAAAEAATILRRRLRFCWRVLEKPFWLSVFATHVEGTK